MNTSTENKLTDENPDLAAVVRDFWTYMTGLYGTEVIDKENAIEMQVVAQVLGFAGIMDADDFLSKYTTTIGKRIYVPFEIGTESEDWSLWDQILVCVHEHEHVEQFNREGALWFASKYLFSTAGRAAYEAESYRCDMEIDFWHTGQVINPVALAAKLVDYGCTSIDIEVAEKVLVISAEMVKRGGVVNLASVNALAWLNENAAFLKAQAPAPEPA